MTATSAIPALAEVINLAKRLSAAGYAAIDAQRQYDHWSSFGTNSLRARRAEERLDTCLKTLEDADRELADLIARGR